MTQWDLMSMLSIIERLGATYFGGRRWALQPLSLLVQHTASARKRPSLSYHASIQELALIMHTMRGESLALLQLFVWLEPRSSVVSL